MRLGPLLCTADPFFSLPLCSQGGVVEGQLVELSNGGMAVVVSATAEEVVLDANSMMAGKTLRFELELVELERPEA